MNNTAPASINDYGGVLVDLGGVGVVDPTTDQSATAHSQSMADLAAVTHTAARAWVYFTPGTTPLIATHDAMWGNAVAPTVTHVSTGVYDVTWPASFTDALNNAQTVNLRAAWATAGGTTPLVFAMAQRTAANVVRVTVFNTSFAATDTGFAIFVGAV